MGDAAGRRWSPWLLAAALALVGCDSSTGPTTGTRATTRGAAPPGATPATNALPSTPPAPSDGRRRPSAPTPASALPAASGGGGLVVTHDEGTEEDPEAVLSRALERAFGAPVRCLSAATRDALGDHLTVNVSVRVLPSGRVVSATVTGAGLSDEDIDCMRTHAEGLRLPGPIERAPRAVAAQVRYEIEDTRVTRTETEGPGPRELGAGTLAPDSVLPPAGTETDRPGGFVAPSSTLPALNEPGPAPGYVPPGSTLPARAEE